MSSCILVTNQSMLLYLKVLLDTHIPWFFFSLNILNVSPFSSCMVLMLKLYDDPVSFSYKLLFGLNYQLFKM